MGLAGICWQRLETPERQSEAWTRMWRMTANTAPLIIVALISAGLFAELLPETLVRNYLGDASGILGISLGVLMGILTPGGTFVCFALAGGALGAGAAYPAIVAYVTAWSMLAITKLLAEEMAFLGPRFILTRAAFCLPVPLICGVIAQLAP